MSLEPIAMIGMGCRFPGGGNSPKAFWRLLRKGVDAISEVPPTRFDIDAFYDPRPAIPGKIVTRWGGFLDQIDQFGPYFFHLSPREATLMDPQQRLLLEVAWEAAEDAGQVPERLAGSQTGVFIGMCYNGYEIRERFSRYGLESARATSLLATLSALLNRPLSPTLVWDHPDHRSPGASSQR